MIKILLTLFLGVALGVRNHFNESRNTRNSDSAGFDDWLSTVMKEAEARPKRDDFEEFQKAIKIEIPEGFKKVQVNSFDEDHFNGMRHEAIIRVWTTDMDRDNLKQCLGVVIQKQTIVTPCSCVSYNNEKRPYARPKISAFNHEIPRLPVTPIHGSEIFMVSLPNPRHAVRGDTTVLHPRCDNQYEVDIAAVITVFEIPDVKVVWVHTAENMFFDNNLVQALSAQAVLGKCAVTVVSHVAPNYDQVKDLITLDFIPIFYQHWAGCFRNVCPKLGDPDDPGKYDKARCDNKIPGTRYCIGWNHKPDGLCSLLPGTPVFCDVGEVTGFMGFIISQPYFCPKFKKSNAILQGFNDAINWIRYILELGVYPQYETLIPDWVKNFRSYDTPPKAKYVDPEKGRRISGLGFFDFDNFKGAAAEAIVLVYYKTIEKCHGTLINHLIAVVPASCVTEQIIWDVNANWESKVEQLKLYPLETLQVLGFANFLSRLRRRYVKVEYIHLHDKADSHYDFDYAFIQLRDEVENMRIAWVNTIQPDTFTRIINNLPAADMVYGNCYYVRGQYIHQVRGQPVVKQRTRRIRFEHWNSCLDIVCSRGLIDNPDNSARFRRDLLDKRCLKTKSNPGSKFCISGNPFDGQLAQPLCTVPSGTPIFCDVEEARGYIGFISRMWTDCPEHKNASMVEKDKAVIVGLNEFIFVIKTYTMVWSLKDMVLPDVNIQRKKSSSPAQSKISLQLQFLVLLLAARDHHIL